MSLAVLDQPSAESSPAVAPASSQPHRDRAVQQAVPMRVAIAAPTVDRPDGLRRLLDGLAELTFVRVPEPDITVVIIDNGRHPTAAPIVDAYRPLLRWPIVYHHEPRRGLVHARNAQLETAPATADWLAMIDDDEVPVPEWLDSLLAVAVAHGADFVAGPVVPAFVETPPTWAPASRFFEAGPFTDGAPIDYLYTGNALVSLRAVRTAGWRFEMAFNHSGGEDEHFFARALASGLKAVTAADARVHETIPPSKTTVHWVMRRYFRMGTTTAAIDRLNDPSPLIMVRRCVLGCGRVVVGLATMATVVGKGKLALVKGISDLARGAGSIVGLFGIHFAEYRPPKNDAEI